MNIKKRWIVLSAIALFFILTNPDLGTFKEFHGSENIEYFKRTSNWILFSFYEDEFRTGEKYLAIGGNFFKLSKDIPNDTERNRLDSSATTITP